MEDPSKRITSSSYLGQKKKKKKKKTPLPEGVVFVKEPQRTGGSLYRSFAFGEPWVLCRAGFICWSVVEPASGWVYARDATNRWASVPISENRPALVG